MGKNYMPEVARMLGVEIGEEFDVLFQNGCRSAYNPYRITADEIVDCAGNGAAYNIFIGLLNGECTPKKRPWRPKDVEQFWLVKSDDYKKLLELGCKPEEARAVLPNSLKTEVVMTANLREWRHFFKQRCQKAAHPQIRELALALLKYFHEELPEVFEDLWEIYYYSDIAFDLPEVKEAWQTE
jgi:hypothetical protein